MNTLSLGPRGNRYTSPAAQSTGKTTKISRNTRNGEIGEACARIPKQHRWTYLFLPVPLELPHLSGSFVSGKKQSKCLWSEDHRIWVYPRKEKGGKNSQDGGFRRSQRRRGGKEEGTKVRSHRRSAGKERGGTNKEGKEGGGRPPGCEGFAGTEGGMYRRRQMRSSKPSEQ
ncbi:hypothetical protein VTK73DRAFT_6086 [Phialemonium thermophilum]|uniref:Uncharacterized protein n=1 Tax=Phialemonium thermophilum TaxID=223376 RepID=A0ABR3V037_9PEZI